MKIKKIPYYLTLLILTSGASLILGFLSFGGMLALWPILPLAFTAFVLSVAYEGEIYLQNIKGALNKLFKHNHLERQLANRYLLENFPADTTANTCPQFFKDYAAQLNLLHHFGHGQLDKAGTAQKRRADKTLRDMEKWFALQLFSKSSQQQMSPYEKELGDWLLTKAKTNPLPDLDGHKSTFNKVKAFSMLAGAFMGLGTTYLLIEAFSAIPFFATLALSTWPLLIVPMAAIAGAAYGLLTYNAVTDMISNNTLRTWYNKLREDLGHGLTLRNGFMTVTALTLVALALALTICTAGTWWTVAKETRPLFTWMGKMPGFVMGVINPMITGLSAVVFNLQNTSESLKMIDDATKSPDSFFTRAAEAMKKGYSDLKNNENWLQIINPFRIILKLTMMPLRIILFLGHLISIGVTADRVPGVSQVASALLGIISEGFEDAHYFMGHDHPHAKASGCDGTHKHHHHEDTQTLLKERLGADHGHNHDVDLPTRILKLIFLPVYLLATSWDYLASKKNEGSRRVLGFHEAWGKQTGVEEAETADVHKHLASPSQEWQKEHAVYRIERHKEKHLKNAWVGSEIAKEKSKALTDLQQDIRNQGPSSIKTHLTQEKTKLYATHRFFANGSTSTETFLSELPARISGPAA